MEKNDLKENWPLYRDSLLKEYPQLKAEDLNRFEDEEELLIHLQEKLGKTKKEIKNWLQFLG